MPGGAAGAPGMRRKDQCHFPQADAHSSAASHVQESKDTGESPLPRTLHGCLGRKWLPFKELERFLAGIAAKHPRRWVPLAEEPGTALTCASEVLPFVNLRFPRISKQKKPGWVLGSY